MFRGMCEPDVWIESKHVRLLRGRIGGRLGEVAIELAVIVLTMLARSLLISKASCGRTSTRRRPPSIAATTAPSPSRGSTAAGERSRIGMFIEAKATSKGICPPDRDGDYDVERCPGHESV